VAALLIALNGVFALSELAIVSARPARLRTLMESGRRGASIALELTENPGKFLSTVQIGITLIGILAGAYGQAAIAGELTRIIETAFPAAESWAEIASTAVVVVGITYVSLIVGELVPKRLALIFPEAIAAKTAGPISTLAIVLHPFVSLLTASTSGILKIMGV
jgi:putative hemolysin